MERWEIKWGWGVLYLEWGVEDWGLEKRVKGEMGGIGGGYRVEGVN